MERAESEGSLIVIVAQRTLTAGDPEPDDLYRVGTLCKIESSTPGEGDESRSRHVVVTGVTRYRVLDYELLDDDYLAARGELVSDVCGDDQIRSEALLGNLKELAREVLELLPGATEPLVKLVGRVEDASYLSNVCAAYLNMPLGEKQDLLETPDVEERMEKLLRQMRKEREVLNVQREIRDKMSERLNKAQREALLREQLRTIRTELGEESGEDTADELASRVERAGLSDEAARQAREELRRLRALPSASAEYHVIRTYLEWLAALPWEVRSESRIDLERARRMLDQDHYGLEAAKKRIIQYLAVAKLRNDLRGTILCLVGPPGVGKTSLGQSIARALGRRFVRASLGGIRDEAEVRGHRRTYVGAMPGRILQSLKRAGTRNPVMVLDEIDKLRSDLHGDPSAAMLEVLDPDQNRSFVDHYLDVAFDLSDVFFVCTANVADAIPAPLLDRMEVIEVSGYTHGEKLEIAKRHLVPKLLAEHGLRPEWLRIPDEALRTIISGYTREAGVRELKRKIAACLRSAAAERVANEESGVPALPLALTPETLRRVLGPEPFALERAERVDRPGIATGLAWTPFGGTLLFVEATALAEGTGELTLTGQLGEVMRESARLALSLARAAVRERLPGGFDFARHDLHVHVPAGAIPKDGPSAGVTIFCALMSLLLGRRVSPKLGMTGELTLRGAILPVGGIKEKCLAAHRAGLERMLIPRRNEHDLPEVPAEILSRLQITLIDTAEELLEQALEPGPVESDHQFTMRLSG